MNLQEGNITENAAHICNISDLKDMKISKLWQPVKGAFFPVLASGWNETKALVFAQIARLFRGNSCSMPQIWDQGKAK